jgi:hypothetical protein
MSERDPRGPALIPVDGPALSEVEGLTIRQVIADAMRDPVRTFVVHWNWKSALTSALCRAGIFFVVNLPAGLMHGVRAMATEMIFRGVASGVMGTMTQAFARAHHSWVALIILPALGHTLEYAVHQAAGTPRLGQSIVASVAFSVFTTSFNLFAMRRGALVVGAEGQSSLRDDFRRLPGLFVSFLRAGVSLLWIL